MLDSFATVDEVKENEMKMILSFPLYGALGVALYFSGISAMEKPFEFFAIIVIVGLIDFVSTICS